MTRGTRQAKGPWQRVRRVVLRIMTFLLVTVVVLTALLLAPPVQTWLAQMLSERLSNELGTTVRIDRLEIRPWGDNRIHGLHIKDLDGDTLIDARAIRVVRPSISLSRHRLSIYRLEMQGTTFHLRTREGTPYSNLTTLLERISSSDTTTASAPWRIVFRGVDIRDVRFTYHDANVEPIPFGVDFDHVDVRRADIMAHDLRIDGDSVIGVLASVSLNEHSGLQVDHLSGSVHVSPSGIHVNSMLLRTPGSEVRGDVALSTSDYDSYDAFEHAVVMRGSFDTSRVQFSDIALFAPELRGMDLPIRIQGQVRGTLDDLKGRNLNIVYGERSRFHGNMELSGLPDFANTFIIADVDHLMLDPEDLMRIPLPPFTSGRTLQLPAEVQRLGLTGFSGNFTGFPSSFTTYGSISTAAGALRTDVTYFRDTVSDVITISGQVATTGFRVDKVLADGTVGNVACDARMTAKGRTLATAEADLNGRVDRITIGAHSIGNIQLNGRFERNMFNGHLECTDPKLQLRFDGLADLRGEWPRVDFNADVQRVDLKAFGLVSGHGYSDLAMGVEAEGLLAPDSLQGAVFLRNVLYCDDSTDLDIGDITLRSLREAGRPLLVLESAVLDLQVEGTVLPTRVHEATMDVVEHLFPALRNKDRPRNQLQDFNFHGRVNHAQPILDRFLPQLSVAADTRFSGRLSNERNELTVKASAPAFGYGPYHGKRVSVEMATQGDLLVFEALGIDQQVGDSLHLGDIRVTGKAYQDNIQLTADWTDRADRSHGAISANAVVESAQRMHIDLLPSTLYLGRGDWQSDGVSRITLEPSMVHVDGLVLENGEQRVAVSGALGQDSTLALAFELVDVEMANLAPLIDGPALNGKLSGDGRLFDLMRSPYMVSYLCLDSLTIEHYPVGDLRFAASWNESRAQVDLHGRMQRDTLEALSFSGSLNPSGAQQLDLSVEMDRFDLRFIDPYLPEEISDIQGSVTGRVAITGTLSDPQLHGKALLDDAGLRINYLNTFYRFTHEVGIHPDMFTFDNVVVRDEDGQRAKLIGTIIHSGLTRWNFDVSGTMEHFNVLSTTIEDNELFYGKAYATGDINVSGYLDNLAITLNARSEKGTDVHFPLGGSKEVGGISFVRFVGADQWSDSLAQEVDLTGITLDLNVEVTPDANLELIFDPTVGDIMRGNGRGNLSLTVTPSGDLSMRGDIDLVEGDYLFTLRNLVNKRFSVVPGGRISWYGDPFNANINIDALYKLRAALYDVMPVALRTEAYKKRVPVEVVMHLTQNLMNPDIGFDVRLPSVDEGVRTQVQSALATTDDLNKQVFSLIMINRFQPSDATAGAGNTSALSAGGATTGTELFSNQVSNWLSQLSNEFDLGVNWRAGDNITQDEVELAVSTQVLNDRLLLSTNVGVRYGATGTQQNNLIGDFSAEFILTQNGKVRLKAYSQSNDRNLNQADQAPTTQGVGIGFRHDFD